MKRKRLRVLPPRGLPPIPVPVTRVGEHGLLPTSQLCAYWKASKGRSTRYCQAPDGETTCEHWARVFKSVKNGEAQTLSLCNHPEAPIRMRQMPAVEQQAYRQIGLDAIAAFFCDAPGVVGFRVVGDAKGYEDIWDSESRSPQRWRSGEWHLEGGHANFEPIFQDELRKETCPMPNREPAVKFYKDEGPGGNGAFATATTAQTPEEFLSSCAMEMETLLEDRMGDWYFTMDLLLPQICELWAKLKGYKADGVFEKRYLVAGEPNPEAHMRCINLDPQPSPADLRLDVNATTGAATT